MSRERKVTESRAEEGQDEHGERRTEGVHAAADVFPLRSTRPAVAPPSNLGFADGLVREIAQAILRLAAEDPNLIHRVVGALGVEGSTNAPDRLLMKKTEYAERIGYSVRTLDKFIEAGLPTHGRGKRLRIVVAKADEWLLSQDADHLEEVDLLAMQNARKGRGGGVDRE